MAVVVLALELAGCSSLPNYANPIEWYRYVSGASADDVQDQGARNSANLEAGANEPYPNLATVPAVPDSAMSTIDRDKLKQGLVADRTNARYSDSQLREGHDVPPMPGQAPQVALASPSTMPPPPGPAPTQPGQGTQQAQRTQQGQGAQPGTPKKGTATPPAESALAPPTINNLPQGQTPRAAPPPPGAAAQGRAPLPPPAPPPQVAAIPPAALPTPRPAPPPPSFAPVEPGAEPTVMREPGGKQPAVTLDAAEIAFAGDGKSLTGDDNRRLAEAAQLQKEGGASLRVIGYAARGSGSNAAQQELQSFSDALDRANAVAAELARLGVPSARITVQAAPALGGGGLPPGQVEVLLEY